MNMPPPVEWADLPIDRLLTLDRIGPSAFRNLPNDTNHNGRSYGGHSIALALLAAARTVADDRPASSLQLMFLRGTLPDAPVDYKVSALQDGKRFSARQIRAMQGGHAVLDAHATFARHVPDDLLSHAEALPSEASVRLRDLPLAHAPNLDCLGSYSYAEKSCIDFRLTRPEQLGAPQGCNRLEFWIRARPLPHEGIHGKSVSFAYLSDWWITFACLSGHIAQLQRTGAGIYVASLNHSIWFHVPHDPREWMLFVCDSPRAIGGRGLALASVYDIEGRLVATVSQECLMASRLVGG